MGIYCNEVAEMLGCFEARRTKCIPGTNIYKRYFAVSWIVCMSPKSRTADTGQGESILPNTGQVGEAGTS